MPAEKFLRHIVLFKFNGEASPEQIDEVGKAFLALHSQIETIQDVEWGSAINEPEPYTHCLLVTVRSEADLQAYGEHPAHSAVGEHYGHLVENVAVLDFWSKQ
jgi:stress responsive alpha/beta barrel protein